MLKLNNVCWGTPEAEGIINGINLEIGGGKLTVITGPNGGGKTSLAKLIAGLRTATDGQIFLDDTDITNMSITDRAKLGIAYAFQQPVRFKGLTVKDLLELSAEGSLDHNQLCELLGKVGLCAQEYINRSLDGGLSGGEMKRIEIASVLARKNARLLIFDEPEAGIDLWSFTNLIEAFQSLKKERDNSILVISHQERILEIADEIVVISAGKVRVSGSTAEILPDLLNEEKESRCPIGKDRVVENA